MISNASSCNRIEIWVVAMIDSIPILFKPFSDSSCPSKDSILEETIPMRAERFRYKIKVRITVTHEAQHNINIHNTAVNSLDRKTNKQRLHQYVHDHYDKNQIIRFPAASLWLWVV